MTNTTKDTNSAQTLQDYTNLVTNLDEAIAQSAARHAARLKCRAGCSSCCKPFSVQAVEAEAMKTALTKLDRPTITRIADSSKQPAENCPFLINNLCAIYQQRPLICRSQGLAIAYIDHQREAIDVSACPINFPEDEEYPFTEQDLLFMDSFNERLAEINQDFCTPKGLHPEERIHFHTIATGK